MLNDPLEHGIVGQVVHDHKICAVGHVEDQGFDGVAPVGVMGWTDPDAEGIDVDIPLAEGFVGQTAAVREGDADHFIHVSLIEGPDYQHKVCPALQIIDMGGDVVDQVVAAEGTHPGHGLVGCQLRPQLRFYFGKLYGLRGPFCIVPLPKIGEGNQQLRTHLQVRPEVESEGKEMIRSLLRNQVRPAILVEIQI